MSEEWFDADDLPTVVVLEPHQYTEASARARLERRRKQGEELVMREFDGHWYIGRLVRGELVEDDT